MRLFARRTTRTFTRYGRTTIRRRIERRMMLRRIESLDDYCEFLDREPGELAALHQDLLIRVTEFFGDPTAFEALRQYRHRGRR